MAELEPTIEFVQRSVETLTGQKFPNAVEANKTREEIDAIVGDSKKVDAELKDADAVIYRTPPPDFKFFMYFPPHVTEALSTDQIQGWSPVIEETSHFCFNSFYAQKHGFIPIGANTEMIGAIDKYFILYALNRKQETVKGIDMDLAEGCFAAAEDPSGFNIEHIVGHQLGKSFFNDMAEMGQSGLVAYQALYVADNWHQVNAILEGKDLHEVFKHRFDECKAYVREHYMIDI